ncbi:MAG: hypothetical protein JSV05_05040 [Candidatus Bathyarchaeota archaeon]|nr:MAG: hypothetical protein JSV05_05040 [Candidatus Bathyarchaeota archaeon]
MLNSDRSALIKGGVATTYEQMRDARRKRKKKSRMTRFRMTLGVVAISFVVFFSIGLAIAYGPHTLPHRLEGLGLDYPELDVERLRASIPSATVFGLIAAFVAGILRAWW